MGIRSGAASRIDWDRVERLFPGLDPDVPLRYGPILRRLREGERILEIGRGEVGLVRLLDIPMVTCDLVPPARFGPGEAFVRATGTRLPFSDRSFDAVVAVDVLEHVPPDLRGRLIAEATRVARERVFLACPCDGSARAEARHRRVLEALQGTANPWLVEHLERSLPREEDILRAVPPAWSVERIPNLNLAVWWTSRIAVDVAHRPLRVLGRLDGLLDFGRTYRTVFVLERGD